MRSARLRGAGAFGPPTTGSLTCAHGTPPREPEARVGPWICGELLRSDDEAVDARLKLPQAIDVRHPQEHGSALKLRRVIAAFVALMCRMCRCHLKSQREVAQVAQVPRTLRGLCCRPNAYSLVA